MIGIIYRHRSRASGRTRTAKGPAKGSGRRPAPLLLAAFIILAFFALMAFRHPTTPTSGTVTPGCSVPVTVPSGGSVWRGPDGSPAYSPTPIPGWSEWTCESGTWVRQ